MLFIITLFLIVTATATSILVTFATVFFKENAGLSTRKILKVLQKEWKTFSGVF